MSAFQTTLSLQLLIPLAVNVSIWTITFLNRYKRGKFCWKFTAASLQIHIQFLAPRQIHNHIVNYTHDTCFWNIRIEEVSVLYSKCSFFWLFILSRILMFILLSTYFSISIFQKSNNNKNWSFSPTSVTPQWDKISLTSRETSNLSQPC